MDLRVTLATGCQGGHAPNVLRNRLMLHSNPNWQSFDSQQPTKKRVEKQKQGRGWSEVVQFCQRSPIVASFDRGPHRTVPCSREDGGKQGLPARGIN